jgi:lipid-A-disaccharide synthase
VNLLTTRELFPADVTPYDPNQPDADEVLFPEYLTCEDKSPQIAAHVIEWLTDAGKRQARVEQLARLKAQVAHGGASGRAAEYILNALSGRQGAPRLRLLQAEERLASAKPVRPTPLRRAS